MIVWNYLKQMNFNSIPEAKDLIRCANSSSAYEIRLRIEKEISKHKEFDITKANHK